MATISLTREILSVLLLQRDYIAPLTLVVPLPFVEGRTKKYATTEERAPNV